MKKHTLILVSAVLQPIFAALLLAGCIFPNTLAAQPTTIPPIEWSRCYGTDQPDFSAFTSLPIFKAMITTPDGGYLFVMNSPLPDHEAVAGGGNIVKINGNGGVVWVKHPANFAEVFSISPTLDGNYIIVGNQFTPSCIWTTSIPLIAKLSPTGVFLWTKAYSGGATDTNFNDPITLSNIEPTADGGYIAIGSTEALTGQYALLHNSTMVPSSTLLS